jgi:hypothetical protein
MYEKIKNIAKLSVIVLGGNKEKLVSYGFVWSGCIKAIRFRIVDGITLLHLTSAAVNGLNSYFIKCCGENRYRNSPQ